MWVLLGLGVALAIGLTSAYVAGKSATKMKKVKDENDQLREEVADLRQRVERLEQGQ